MKKAVLLNSEISYVIAKMGHFDTIAIGDAGLPIPKGVDRIDLAIISGVPSFEDVLTAVLSELQVQKATIASEMRQHNPSGYQRLQEKLLGTNVCEVPHETFKKLTGSCVAIIRTGETRPYSNIILESGVTF